ncbi:ATP-binding cassette domain-containing protein [Nocardioides astragali]|uniref:ATP-binding cassette domain-containing protein n=1 Tax=Nocardioides astragali TaxID=1776736 RepID=A0ABW2MZN4_9ACTN|nr:ATP-binding cassette domain-containing protein [Nocardioides astragali]
MNKLLLEVNDLGVVYRGRGRRKDKVALDGVSVAIGAGETLGLVGESGSGKSTLGGCVLGLVRPEHGSITFDGRDITRLAARDRRTLSTQIQAVFQDPYSSFNPHRTIEQTVSETLTNLPRMSRQDRRTRVVAMLERVGLDGSALERFPAQFSGGQRQRIAIARALLPEPRLVVCDESVSALDLSVQAQVLNLLLELQADSGVTYLFITHDLSVVRHMSTRVAVLEHGHLVEEGGAREVTDHPTHPYTRKLIAASPGSDAEVQEARRETRRAMARLEAGGTDADVHALHALEIQAVIEALAEPLSGATGGFARVLNEFTHEPVALDKLVRLRAAILDLAPRTSAAMTSEVVNRRVADARERLCRSLAENDRALHFAAQCREILVAIDSRQRERAVSVVASFDDTRVAEHRATTGRP